MSARAVRALRERIAGTEDLELSLDREALVDSVGPEARMEEDPELYVHGMLVHEGLHARGDTVEPGAVDLRLGPDYAVAGALWTTAAAVPVATIGLWVYGILVAFTGAGVAWGLRRTWPRVARRAPSFVPRGRLLGAAAAAVAIALLGLAVIYPIREIRRPDDLGAARPAVVR